MIKRAGNGGDVGFLTKSFDEFLCPHVESVGRRSVGTAIPAPLFGAKTVTTYLQTGKTLLLACEDHDFGEVAASKAKVEAQTLANQEGKPVYVRDPLTDKVLRVVKPRVNRLAPTILCRPAG